MSVLPVPNQDSQWADFSGLYAKALEQALPGIPDATVFKALIKEIDRGVAAGPLLPIAHDLFEPAQGVALGGTTRENGPQAAFAAQVLGTASPGYTTVPAPTVGSDDYAVELAELYWASLLRDVPFTAFVNDTTHPVITAAVKNLNDHPWARSRRLRSTRSGTRSGHSTCAIVRKRAVAWSIFGRLGRATCPRRPHPLAPRSGQFSPRLCTRVRTGSAAPARPARRTALSCCRRHSPRDHLPAQSSCAICRRPPLLERKDDRIPVRRVLTSDDRLRNQPIHHMDPRNRDVT
jgi:hypothetical protein